MCIVCNLVIDCYCCCCFESDVFVEEEVGEDIYEEVQGFEVIVIGCQILVLVSQVLDGLLVCIWCVFELYCLIGLSQCEIVVELGILVMLVNFLICDVQVSCCQCFVLILLF